MRLDEGKPFFRALTKLDSVTKATVDILCAIIVLGLDITMPLLLDIIIQRWYKNIPKF